MTERRFTTAKGLLDHILDLRYFHREGKLPPAIPVFRENGQDPLAVLVGDNASGKSFVRRLAQAICHQAEVECIHVSMEGRTDGGIMRAFIYGAEQWESTGQISSHAVVGGISTCRGREKPHVIFWDEPDLGLSDSWAAGVGVAIRQFAADPPKNTKGIFVVTHSKHLVSQLIELEPHYLHFGDEDPPQSLAEWVAQPVVPKDIEKLGDISHKRFKKIQRILNDVQKGKKK